MLVDSLIVPECIYRPGSFSGLMTVYESAESFRVSRSPRDLDLHADVQQREPYTTTLKLTYWFEEGRSEPVPDPDLIVRVYHDARLAEAVAGCDNHHHAKLREIAMRHSLELGRRWRDNIMLNKWLDYLIDMGHAFP